MKLNLHFEEEKLPVYVLFFVTLKAIYVAFSSFFVDVLTTIPEDLFNSRFITDDYLWLPMLIFFVYFYLYRKGKMNDLGLKYAIACALFAIIPKIALFMASIYFKDYKNFAEFGYNVLELMGWALVYTYMVSFWYSNLVIRKHHHHHHHQHSHHHHHHHTMIIEDGDETLEQ